MKLSEFVPPTQAAQEAVTNCLEEVLLRNTIPGLGPAATEEPKSPFAVRMLPGKPGG